MGGYFEWVFLRMICVSFRRNGRRWIRIHE